MYLVDTSVWIDYLAGSTQRHVTYLNDLLANPIAVGITGLITMEVLQGARDDAAFDRLRAYFSSQRSYGFADLTAACERAARLYVDCRRHGITVRSSVDCLVAQCAIENEIILLHNDRDFVNIAKVEHRLRHKTFLG